MTIDNIHTHKYDEILIKFTDLRSHIETKLKKTELHMSGLRNHFTAFQFQSSVYFSLIVILSIEHLKLLSTRKKLHRKRAHTFNTQER